MNSKPNTDEGSGSQTSKGERRKPTIHNDEGDSLQRGRTQISDSGDQLKKKKGPEVVICLIKMNSRDFISMYKN